MDAFSTGQHIQALQNQNTQNLLDIFGTSETPEVDFEPEQSEDSRSKTQQAMIAGGNMALQYFLSRSGAIGGIDSVNAYLAENERRVQGMLELRMGPFWQPLQNIAHEMSFKTEAYLSLQPVPAAVGSKLGRIGADAIAKIPGFGMILGPIAKRWLPLGFAALGTWLGETFFSGGDKTIINRLDDWSDVPIPHDMPAGYYPEEPSAPPPAPAPGTGIPHDMPAEYWDYTEIRQIEYRFSKGR
jgi:hypothetical protein